MPDQATGADWTRWLWISLIVLAADQATKLWILELLQPGQSIPLFPGFNLVLAFNRGAAFSMLAQADGWQRPLFITIAIVASATMLYLLRRHAGQRLFCAALALLLGGAIGNLYDRITYGHVVDFIDVYWATYHWPAFNIADSAICIGAGLMIWDSFKSGKNEAQQ